MPVTIMLVEDDKQTRDMLWDYLSREPTLQVIAEAASGTEAVALAERLRPDIILMDLSLEGTHGLKATKQIKKSCLSIDIVILTSYAFDDLKERARESPQLIQSTAFLAKDQISTQLLPVIKSIAEQREKQAGEA